MTNADDQLVTRKQAADKFKVTVRTIDRWRKRGLLKGAAIGGVVRFRLDDLAAVVRRALG
ncbi:helix-turn-helix domain-containing protein [Urbifossiella limnaea]|uniref:Helix-turn-helix domain protein n=1 Tax=Urbifossiella limnaea TaxID=2528023 RepID=A0A517XLT0_9BACT|nr:helix-turn-helix domain-containing protein [Urbifossiella limnaea]QDU18467.1 Helix-turn-helix domain protein [Urbifossiella limnaea]